MAHSNTFIHSPIFSVSFFILALCVALGASRFGHSNAVEDAVDTPLVVEVLADAPEHFEPAIERYVGRVEAGQRVELGFDIPSVVTKISKREGESFVKGELLAELDTRRLKAQKNELQARLERSVAMLKLAETSLQRSENLRRSGNISEQSLDEAQRQKDAALADKSLALAQLESVDVELEKSLLYAPFDGVVIERLSDEGRTVSLGLPVLLIEETGDSNVQVSVALDLARNLKPGDPLALRRGDLVFDGTIDRVKLSLSNRRVSEVYIVASDGGPELVPGEIIQVDVGIKNLSSGVWIPVSALTEYGRGLWSVYLAKPESNESEEARVSRTVVEMVMVKGDYALVTGGITKDELPFVIKDSTHRVVAGQQVRVSSAQKVSGVQ